MKNFPTLLLVVAVALIDERGRVLMQKRPGHKQHGGLWEFPGGKVEPAESCASALIREIKEELAIQIAKGDLVELAFAADETSDPDLAKRTVILLYTCHRWSGTPENLDAETIEWFDPAELCRLPMPPLDLPLAKRLEEALK